jgi:Tol biopolymer transport system component
MGDVYRGHDSTLGRDVAIKILPATLTTDGGRLARFDREARVLASLNHPHIGAIYGHEEFESQRGLILEFVDGETLAERLRRGPVPLTEALQIARQIADGLAAAHEKGIVHRDLKPANIKITSAGVVKVLDFGLAKAADRTPDAVSKVPTVTIGGTNDGAILGTAAYMSPEQARGQAVDKRTDIWALGCVLYEMLTGAQPFTGDNSVDLAAAVTIVEPDWSALPSATPAPIVKLLGRCLAKDRGRRLSDVADARLEIDDALAAPTIGTPTPTTSRERSKPRVWTAAALTAGLVAGAAVAAFVIRPLGARHQASTEVTRVFMDVAPAEQLRATPVDETYGLGRPGRNAMVFAPDGRSLVFSAIRGGQQQLYWRSLAELVAEPIAGTEGGETPFFSPDGKWLGFWAIDDPGATDRINGSLRKVPLPRGGPAVKVCATPVIFGASWGSNDTIVFAQRTGGLWQVSAAGGSPWSLTTIDATKAEFSHRLPFVLPGSKAVLFTATHAIVPNWDRTEIFLQSLVTGERKVLIEGGADARYMPTGHLVYMRAGTLMAVPFDLDRLTVTGGPVALIADVMQAINSFFPIDTGNGQFSVSSSGALVYLPGGLPPDEEQSLLWVDRSGAERPLSVPVGPYRAPRLSPDGQRLAFWTNSLDLHVEVYDLLRGGRIRLTTDGRYGGPSWTPDGTRVAFTAADPPYRLLWRAADGSGAIEQLTITENLGAPQSWTPDGSTMAFTDFHPETGEDIWVLQLHGDRRPRPFLHTPFHEAQPQFSPDGHWLAYVSNESGRTEVYVQLYPGPGARHLISTEGGFQPAWSRDGRELFFTTLPSPEGNIKVMAVSVTAGGKFTVGTPRALFKGRYASNPTVRQYDVAPDGRFLMMRETKRPPMKPTQMILVQNWLEELKARVPTK